MIYIYIFCLIVSALLLIWFVNFNEQHCLQHIMILGFTTVANGGYLAMSLTTNLEEAVLAQKLIYVGGCFLPMAMFFVSCEICNIKLKNWLTALLFFIQVIIYGAVCTIGINDLYYTSVGFEIVDGIPTLIKEYAPFHTIHLISLYTYLLLSILIPIISSKKKDVNLHNVFRMISSAVLSLIVYICTKTFHLKVELMPIAYMIQVILIYLPILKSHVFSIAENGSKQFKEFGTEGFIEFDVMLKFMEADDYVLKIFPELKEFRVNKKLKPNDSLFFESVYSLILENRDKLEDGVLGIKNFSKGDKHYEARMAHIKYQGIKIGYLVEIQDVTDKQNYLSNIMNYKDNLKREVDEKTAEIYSIRDKTLLGFAQMVESRDLSTGGHVKRTTEVVRVFTQQLIMDEYGLSEHFLYNVVRGAAMHDIGKISVRDDVLTKQGRYNDDDYREMKKHSKAGAEIITKVLTGIEQEDFVETVANIAYYHHEKINGSGYPVGLVGDDIPIEARIMALADVFDALVSKRCYKDAYDFDRAFNIIQNEKGTHFDNKLTEEFMKCRPVLEKLYSDINFAEV